MTSLAAGMLKIPLVYFDCGDIIPRLKLKNRIVLPIEKQAIRRAAAIITYNEAGKKRFQKKYGYPAEKIHVIPKPIDTTRFRPDIDTREFKASYDLNGKLIVAYFGRLGANKGARYLLDAAKIMKNRGSDMDIVFLFVGGNVEARHAEEFKNHLDELNLDNVRLTGMVSNADMPQAYAAADIAVFPDVTNLPGFPTVLAESMAAGLPIIIGIKGWEDAVPIVDSQSGLIVKHADPLSLADNVERLANDPELRRKLSDNVHKFAVEEMEYERVVEKYFEMVLKIIGKPFGEKAVDQVEYADNNAS